MNDLVTLHLGSRQPKRYCHPHEKPKFPAHLSLAEARDLMFPINPETSSRDGYGWEGDEDEHGKLAAMWEAGDFLHEDQPGIVKCRVKIRLSKNSNFEQSISEIARVWHRLDHKEAPAWVASTDNFWAQTVSRLFGGVSIRTFMPEQGDD